MFISLFRNKWSDLHKKNTRVFVFIGIVSPQNCCILGTKGVLDIKLGGRSFLNVSFQNFTLKPWGDMQLYSLPRTCLFKTIWMAQPTAKTLSTLGNNLSIAGQNFLRTSTLPIRKRTRIYGKSLSKRESHPTLQEEDMDLLQLDEAQLQKHRADENLDEALTWIAQHCDGGSGTGSPSPKSTTSMPGTPSAQQQRLKLEAWDFVKGRERGVRSLAVSKIPSS